MPRIISKYRDIVRTEAIICIETASKLVLEDGILYAESIFYSALYMWYTTSGTTIEKNVTKRTSREIVLNHVDSVDLDDCSELLRDAIQYVLEWSEEDDSAGS